MYIVPNTDLRIIRSCPLDKTYENTIYFNSKADQQNYFNVTLSGYNFDKLSYQRIKKGTIRVAKSAESMYDCNYMAFRNTSFGNKWFYAFIDKIEYINNTTSEIYYTLDVIQTWFFDYALANCLVEREHTESDNIGDNLLNEGLDTGEYICDDYIMPEVTNSYDIVFWCTFDQNYDPVGGSHFNQGYQHTYSGLTPTRFPLTNQGAEDAIAWLADVPTLKQSGIVAAMISPSLSNTALERTVTVSKSSAIRRSDNHSIKNNKLYTFPYNFLCVTNNDGTEAVFRYEFFNSEHCVFGVFSDTSPKSECILYPKNYKGITNNFEEKLTLAGYPQVGYNIDAFKAWLAQSLSSIGTVAALAANNINVDVGVGYITSGSMAIAPYGAAGSLAGYSAPTPYMTLDVTSAAGAGSLASAIPVAMAAKLALDGAIHTIMPPQAKGVQGGSVALSRGILNYGIIPKHIRSDFVTIIDDYFSMYGYKVNKLKVPNISSRPEWNFTKTINCKIIGDVPADDTVAIESIFNNGIRFWKNPAHIGNYSYDNSPTIQGGET